MTGLSTNFPTLGDLQSAYRFLTRIPPILRRPIRAAEAYAKLGAELEQRQEDFLGLVREGIFANDRSPYLKLFRHAGCEFEDIETLVHREGIEDTLLALFRMGVYLTVNELKGRTAVIRGSTRFEIAPGDLRDPSVRADWYGQTGGSRAPNTLIPIEFSMLRNHAMDLFADLDRNDRAQWIAATWSVPGIENLRRLIEYSICGTPIRYWFLLVDVATPELHPRYLWSTRLLRLAGKLAGIMFPRPIYVSPQDPKPIVEWMSQVLRAGKIPYLHTSSSCVARICQTAIASGSTMQGARFAMGGEPATTARLELVRRVGAHATSHYSSAESGHIGRGCMVPAAADEVHVIAGRIAVIQPGVHAIAQLPHNALLVTSTMPKMRLILLNASLGDQAEMTRRECGCPLERLGWKTHLHNIRSFEKLTVGGVTFLDTDLIHVLEEKLPKHFGGGPTDYQLVDEETPDGAPRVRLLVHPRLGPLSIDDLRRAFLDAIGAGSGVERVMMLVWRDAGLPIVVREAPRVTGGGKILHVHLDRPNRLLVADSD